MVDLPDLSASEEDIKKAQSALNVGFPDELTRIWRTTNGLELPGGWRFFPVFDSKRPKQTCNDIVYENTTARWPTLPSDLLCIAASDTGDLLVLRKGIGTLEPAVWRWDHETGRTHRWSRGLTYIFDRARVRIARIRKDVERAKRWTGKGDPPPK